MLRYHSRFYSPGRGLCVLWDMLGASLFVCLQQLLGPLPPALSDAGWPHQRVSALRNTASRLAGTVSSVAQATYPSGRTSTIGSVASAGVARSTRPVHLPPMAAPAPAGVRSTNLPLRKIS